jgi:uncharacterized repeat protein (TIGR02543 family)
MWQTPGYLFTGWTGHAIGNANPLSVLMNADKTIGANFTPDPNDTDGDGLTNFQEIVEHGTNPTLPDTDGDTVKDGADAFPLDPVETLDTDHDGTGDNADTDDDGDGFLDGYEVLTGKLPLDPLDKPALVAEARTAIEFTFPAAIGKTYRIEASTDLAAWEIVESGIAGTGGQVQRFYSTRGQPKRYFRVEEGEP